MKKRGFTLAEVMIAMALIGVIASLTIPTFISSSRNKSNATKLATLVSATENAFTSMIAAEAVHELSETAFGQSQTMVNLGKYLKLAGSETRMTKYYNSDNPFITLNKGAMAGFSVTRIFETKNGALLIYKSNPVARDGYEALGGTVGSSIGTLVIDVNGSAKPNIWGRDAFYFRIGDDGILYPAGGLNFSVLEDNSIDNLWDKEGSKYVCLPKNKNIGCTACLIENNYEITY